MTTMQTSAMDGPVWGFEGGWLVGLAQADGVSGGGVGNGGGEVVMPGNPAQTGTPTQGTPPGAPGGVGPGGGTPQQSPGGLFNGPFMFIILAFLAFMIISSMMTGRRERRKRAELLSGIAKHDKVQTIGGIVGTVVEIRDDEITLKVDENSNTRIRFARSAVQQVIKSAGGAAGGAGVAEAGTGNGGKGS